MNKKFTKAAALSIAAVTALSAMALPVSADVTTVNNKVTNRQEMYGTAELAKWYLGYTELVYTAQLTGTTSNVSVNFVAAPASSSLTLATAPLKYDDFNTTAINPDNSNGKYFTKTATAQANISELNKVVSYENKTYATTAADTMVSDFASLGVTNVYVKGGTDAFADWKNCFTNYVKDYNAYIAKQEAYDLAKAKYDSGVTTVAPVATDYKWINHNGVQKDITTTVAAPTTYAGNTTFTLRTYQLQSSITDVKISTLMPTNQTADVATTGEITFIPGTTGTYTLVGDSSSTTDPGSSTDTWYPALASERNVYSTLSYLGNNGKWYTSKALADKYGLGYSGTSKPSNWSDYSSSTSTIYFDAERGYYTTADGTYRYVVKSKTDGFYSTSFGSYRAADGLYYPTITAAKNASYSFNGTTTYTTVYTTANARYFSVKTGNFYPSYTDAVNASGSSSYVIDLSTYKAPSAEYLDYYPNYIFGTSTGNKGTAYIYNSKKVAGWNSIRNYVSYKSKGSAVSIAMNKETTVPESILKAAKSKNVTLQFINSNGSAVVIKGSTITDASDTNVGVSYNAKVIPTSLKNKAKKSNKDVVSTAQIKIGDNGAIGATADVTVKLPAKRSGCTVKAYRYTSSGSLKLVDTSKVAKNGEVTITTDNGGYFLLVVCD